MGLHVGLIHGSAFIQADFQIRVYFVELHPRVKIAPMSGIFIEWDHLESGFCITQFQFSYNHDRATLSLEQGVWNPHSQTLTLLKKIPFHNPINRLIPGPASQRLMFGCLITKFKCVRFRFFRPAIAE